MAALNATTMLTAVRTRIGNPATDGFFSDAVILDMVNEGLQAVTTEADWPWLMATTTFNTVSGTATYDPTTATGWMKTRHLTIDGQDTMDELSLQELRELPTSATGTPQFFGVQNELIVLRPVPNAIFTVIHDYYKIEPELTGTAEPLMPAQFRWAIVDYACYLAHQRIGDSSRYNNKTQAALDTYKNAINRMSDHRRRTTGNRRVRVRPGSGL